MTKESKDILKIKHPTRGVRERLVTELSPCRERAAKAGT